MMNNLFNAIVIVALVGTFVMAPTPEPVPARSRPAVWAPPAVSRVTAPPVDLAANQPPIPFVRGVRPPPLAVAEDRPNEVSLPPAGLDRAAAKAAIEADGYKGVNVLAKEAGGTWRAKAYRGATEVQVTVDGTGRVSAR
jgi:hypothetical protein